MSVVCILIGYSTWHRQEPTFIRKWSFPETQCHSNTSLLSWASSHGGRRSGVYRIHWLRSKKTELLTDPAGLVPPTGVYTTRYCCTGPRAGSQRTSRVLGVGLYTWTFLGNPLTTEEGKAKAYFLSLFIRVEFLLSLLQNLHSVKGWNTLLLKLLIIYTKADLNPLQIQICQCEPIMALIYMEAKLLPIQTSS